MSAVLYFSNVMIPMVLVGFVLAGAVKRVQLFDAFCEGAKDGLKVVAEVFPSLAALLLRSRCFGPRLLWIYWCF